MDLEKLRDKRTELIQYMKDNGYSKNYIGKLNREIEWLLAHAGKEGFVSYERACEIRLQDKTDRVQREYRCFYGLLMRYDLYDMVPCGETSMPLVKQGNYPLLCPNFKEIVDYCLSSAKSRGVSDGTAKGLASRMSAFLVAMQQKGIEDLAGITEADILDFFTNDNEESAYTQSYRRQLSQALSENLGPHTEKARCVLSLLPMTCKKRQNVQFFTDEEVEAVHSALASDSELPPRERAIGSLLFFTGIRGGDIARIEFSHIDWKRDEIRLSQQKTGGELILPLSANVGNAILDYVSSERPVLDDPHIFLTKSKPYKPLHPTSVKSTTTKIYNVAGIRKKKGDRRGTHLFRYHVATSLLQKGIATPIINNTLGHTEPRSLEPYLCADIEGLRRCALSIAQFPVAEEVFDV